MHTCLSLLWAPNPDPPAALSWHACYLWAEAGRPQYGQRFNISSRQISCIDEIRSHMINGVFKTQKQTNLLQVHSSDIMGTGIWVHVIVLLLFVVYIPGVSCLVVSDSHLFLISDHFPSSFLLCMNTCPTLCVIVYTSVCYEVCIPPFLCARSSNIFFISFPCAPLMRDKSFNCFWPLSCLPLLIPFILQIDHSCTTQFFCLKWSMVCKSPKWIDCCDALHNL